MAALALEPAAWSLGVPALRARPGLVVEEKAACASGTLLYPAWVDLVDLRYDQTGWEGDTGGVVPLGLGDERPAFDP